MRVLQGICLSLFAHFFLVWIAQFAPMASPRLKNEIVEFVILNPSQNESRQVVRQAPLPDRYKVQESEDPLRFLSERTQRVKQQTQAAISGMTQNRSQKTSSNADQTPSPSAPVETDHRGQVAIAPKYRTLPNLARDLDLDRGTSTIGEALPKDVSVGSFTALNTDRYLYYSFYARVEELIRFRWETLVQQTIDTTPPERFGHNFSNEWITQVDILLKPTGEVHSTKIMKESGLRGFDQSAIQAFIQAQVFPNPPKDMLNEDGLIRLKYRFHVNYQPKVISRQ